jgi:hypothetical protein
MPPIGSSRRGCTHRDRRGLLKRQIGQVMLSSHSAHVTILGLGLSGEGNLQKSFVDEFT